MALYSQSRLGELFKLIRKDNPNLTTEMTAENVTISQIAATTGAKNTSALVTGVKYKGYRGSRTVAYNRIDLGTLHKNVVPYVTAPVDSDRNLHALLPSINAQLGIFLETGDFPNQTLMMDPLTLEFRATITVNAGHPLYIGSIEVLFRGFAVSLDSLVVARDIDPLKDNSVHQAGRFCQTLLNYGVDYSAVSKLLKEIASPSVTTTFPDAMARQLAAVLSSVDGIPWTWSSLANKPFNMRGLQYYYNGPPIPQFAGSTLNPEPDYRYDRVLVIQCNSTYCTNLAPGANGWWMLIHYDLVEE